MAAVYVDISTSLDGYVAGPKPTLDEPLGAGGEGLHEWAFPTKAWRERHGMAGGGTGPDNDAVEEAISRAGATVMGRRMFSGGEGSWTDDPKANGWWGDEPPFHHPVFVLTHHSREPLERGETIFTFVTDGVENALERAQGAAGGKDVAIGGGGDTIQQALAAGLVDELHIHIAPVLLGGGVSLFGRLGPSDLELEPVSATGSAAAAHLTYRVLR